MFEIWLKEALAKAHLSQAELARQLTAALGRSIDKNAINKILAGSRKLYADELIEVSRICAAPLPIKSAAPGHRVSSIDLYRYLCHGLLVHAVWITDTEGVRAIANVMTESIIDYLLSNNISVEDDRDIFDTDIDRLKERRGTS